MHVYRASNHKILVTHFDVPVKGEIVLSMVTLKLNCCFVRERLISRANVQLTRSHP